MPNYLIAAYAVFWILPLVLILTVWIRQRRIDREVSALETRLAEFDAQPD